MTSIFDRWTDLDPSLALRRIEAVHGSAIFDRYSYLDPQRALRQIESALSVTLDDVAGGLSFASLEAAIDAAVSGGDTPEWVPANAKIYIDLIAPGRAWTEDDGEVAIDTLLGTDANTVNAWAISGYNADNLTADGYLQQSSVPPAFIGSARTKVLAGCTARVLTKRVTDNSDSMSPFIVMSADGNDAVEVDLNVGVNATATSYGGPLSLSIADIINVGDDAVNCVALTITNTRFDLAVNGSSAVAGSLDSSDRPSGNPLVAGVVHLANNTVALQSITIYDALPSIAGLSALSATTNTAPHDITGEWATFNDDNTGSGLSATYQQHVFTDIGGGESFYILTAQTATDAEGNPLTFTLTDDDSGLFDIGPVNQNVRLLADFPNTDPHSFTLRATDPGGLYVEQTFTITVTA